MSIARDAVSGVSWTASATLIGGLQLAQLIVLARFLTPAELGVLAIIQLVVGFAQIFGDAGISNALIFHKQLKKSQLNQLYMVNVILGIVISLLVLIMAVPTASFLTCHNCLYCYVICLGIFIRSLGQQQLALLQQKCTSIVLPKLKYSPA